MGLRWPAGANEIRVEVHPDRFVFRTPRRSFELATTVAGEEDGDPHDPGVPAEYVRSISQASARRPARHPSAHA